MTQEHTQMVVTLSGGYDSVAALLWALGRGPVQALFVDYGQPYREQERRAVRYVAEECTAIIGHPNWWGCRVVAVGLGPLPMGQRWVPFRNGIIAMVAANWAATLGAVDVIVGSKSKEWRRDDPVSFVDSTGEFYNRLGDFLLDYTEAPRQPLVPRFTAPLVGISKDVVMRMLADAGVDGRRLWNCYHDAGVTAHTPCGGCEHCLLTQPLVAQYWPVGGLTPSGR